MRLPAKIAAVALAALPLASAAPSAPARTRADADLKADIFAVMDVIYGHDFDRAGPAAAALEARHPGHPAGPLLEAIVAYQLWTAQGLRDDGTPKAVDRYLSRAADDAQSLEKTAPAEANYYMGAALGFRARGLAAQKHFLSAVPAAASSLRHLKKALALDPSLEDARMGLGMYHYFAARMPPAARPFAALLMGERGDRDKGLAELWAVANSSGIARIEARAVLSMILSKNDEADWNGAETLLVELMARYPRNPTYRLRRVYVAERRGDLERANALADPDGSWIAALHPSLRVNARAWALYRAAECAMLLGRLDGAERRLAALDERRAPKGLRDWIRMRRANLDDARGRRDAAAAVYSRIKDKNAEATAKGFLSAPFPGGPRDVAPFFSGY